MRVIAGSAGGIRLVAPRGYDARPTTDRVKESVFAALGDRVADASVLDLYAGSGALAIEALSRGAARAVLVDRAGQSIVAVKRNLASTRLADRARVRKASARSFLDDDPPPEAPFDLVFCDPPYRVAAGEVAAVLARLREPGWLAGGGAVVVERRGGMPVDVPAGWRTAWERCYGDTLVAVVTPDDTPDDDPHRATT
jgi:16S rRNA (guanine966-N2)-methyltransferase